MNDPFEDHCWKDIVSRDDLEVYKYYRRDVFVGDSPALLAIDLYELAYEGGALPPRVVSQTYPSSCGEYAYAAIPDTKRLFAAARRAKIPIFYTTNETRPDAKPTVIAPTTRRSAPPADATYEIRADFEPQPGDTVIRKLRASAFFGTPLIAYLAQLGIKSLIVIGESTSGCVRASAVDAYSNGFHVSLVEECCYDRSLHAHKMNLFDLHHKYADVLHVDQAVRELEEKAAVHA